MEERKLTDPVYLSLLSAFGDFSRIVSNELNEMMYFVARVADRCGIESIFDLRNYFENNQIEGLPSSRDRFVSYVVSENDQALARTLEYHLESYLSSMRVGNKHFASISWLIQVQVSTDDYYEIINKIQVVSGNVHDAVRNYLSTLKESADLFFEPMSSLMNDCLEPIDQYLQVVLNMARKALYKFVSGVSGCLNSAREQAGKYSSEQQVRRVRWSINGEQI